MDSTLPHHELAVCHVHRQLALAVHVARGFHIVWFISARDFYADWFSSAKGFSASGESAQVSAAATPPPTQPPVQPHVLHCVQIMRPLSHVSHGQHLAGHLLCHTVADPLVSQQNCFVTAAGLVVG